jgi:hypothetical protein
MHGSCSLFRTDGLFENRLVPILLFDLMGKEFILGLLQPFDWERNC